MSSGLVKGPLSLLVIGAAVLLAYKYVPLDEIIDRFNNPKPGTGQWAGTASHETDSTRENAPVVDTPTAAATPPVVPPVVDLSALTPVPAPQAPVVDSTPPVRQAQNRQVADAVTERAAPAVIPTRAKDAVATAPVVATTPPRETTTSPGQTTSVPSQATKRQGQAALPAAVGIDKPVAAPPAPKPSLRILVEADADDSAGLGSFTPQSYAARLRAELTGVAIDTLGAENVAASQANMAFRQDLKGGRAGIEQLCGKADTERLLLADLTIPSDGFSAIPSAYWPEVVFTAINCRDGRLHKSQKKRLEPANADSFDYQQGFSQASQRFVASQAYFLKP